MSRRLRSSARFWVAALLLATAAAPAQDFKQPEGRTRLTVGISISSGRARLQNLLPKLRETIAHDLKDQAKGVRVIALPDPAKALAQAREKGCDYLLEMKISQASQIEMQLAGDRPARPEPVDEQMGKNIEGQIRIAYRLVAVNGTPVQIQDEFPVLEQEYPLEQDPTAFESMVIRAARGAASAAMDKLEKKKGI